MIHWEWVEVQISHTMSSVSHSMDTQQYPLNGIQKKRCGRFVPQPTLNEALITTVSIEWDTEDMVWEICTSTHSQWIIDHNSIHWMGYRRHGVGDLYPNPLGYCCDQWFIESGLGYKSPTPCLLYPIQWILLWSMIHWQCVEVQISHTMSSVCIHWMRYRRHGVGDLYLNPLSMNHWSQQYPLNGIQKTWCGRLVPQPTLNESLISTVSIEWDTEDMVWEICTSTHSQ
jgi:hypothetical protein